MLSEILNHKVVPVAVFDNQEQAEETLFCLKTGGIGIVEITYRTVYAGEAIKYATEKYPEILTGAGTVTNVEQCKDAVSAGAKFIVSPGFSKDVAKYCKKKDILYIPGVVTPTEIMLAKDMGLTLLKFFPFSSFGGLETVKALSGPFPEIKFMLTGGINGDNFIEALSTKNVVVVGGSWMIKGSKKEKLDRITKITQEINGLKQV